MILYTLNLIIILIITYRIFIGVDFGLFNEFINLVNFLFCAGISLILFRTLSPYIHRYICPNESYARFISLWVLFLFFISILWSVKQFFFFKIHSMTNEKTIPFPIIFDKIAGAIIGIIFGINLISFILVSLYIAPATNHLYRLHEKDKIIFKTEERFPRTVHWFYRDFDWEEFLHSLKPPRRKSEWENNEQEETPVETENTTEQE